MLDSSVEAVVCACSSKFVTVCLLVLLRVRIPPTLPPTVEAVVLPLFPLVDPDDAVGIPVACRLLAVADGRGIYYNVMFYGISTILKGSVFKPNSFIKY